MSTRPQHKVIPITPVAANGQPRTESLYIAQPTIHPRTVTGRFANWRWAMVVLTQLVFYGLPWLEWGQRQLLLFDIAARRFYLFGLVLYPQDFIYLTGLLVVSALSLFLFTAVAGRLWCGFACPQKVYTEIFMWVERLVEGNHTARQRLDDGPLSLEKWVKKSYKHLVWLALALWTGFTFVGYFTPIRELGMAFLQTRMGSWEVFWVVFYGLATYGNAGFMREQVCKYMCPYARFQSAMFDRDTLIVSYDTARGDPRGSRPRSADRSQLSLGDCIDCKLCVQVCPTGIDIRDGLQYECIGCAGCVDACDGVMDKMHYPRGLIRFTTQQALARGGSSADIWRRILRPRVVVYGLLLSGLSVALVVSLANRATFKVDVVRDRGTLARLVPGGYLENVYRLQIMNATEQAQHFHITVDGLPGLRVASDGDTQVLSTESRWVPVRLQLPDGSTAPGSHPIQFVIHNTADQHAVREASVFIVPR